MELVGKVKDAGSMLWTSLSYGERIALIYVGMVAFAVYAMLKAGDASRKQEDRLVKRIVEELKK